jgi:acyl homoserine lactone synthase
LNSLCIVSPQNRQQYQLELDAFFKLRKDVLIDQRGWNLTACDGKEIDQFDHDQAHYLLCKSNETGQILGGVRLTPTLAPNLTLDIFSHLIDPKLGFSPSPYVWESSRYVTAPSESMPHKGLIKEVTLVLFIGMIEYGLYHKIHSLLTMTEVRLERIGRMVGWHLNRLGNVAQVGNTYAVIGLIEISENMKQKMRTSAGIWRNVLPMYPEQIVRLPHRIRRDTTP